MSQSGGSGTMTSGTPTSGTLSGSSYGTRSFGSEDNSDLRARMDLKRKRRKESNRESAKRSRLRKQHHLDELTTQVNQLRTKKQQLVAALNLTTQGYAAAETQNSVLRTQATELDGRLRALREILCCMSDVASAGQLVATTPASAGAGAYYYPSSLSSLMTMMTPTAAATTITGGGYDVLGGGSWGSAYSGMQMTQTHMMPQQPVELMYPVQW